jgi:ribosomal protein S18 acetylase RimI-like enzyme
VNVTTAGSDADEASRAWFAGIGLLARGVPGMYEKPGRAGVVALVSGIPLPTLNGIFAETAHPDVAEVAAFADDMKGLGVPWCMRLRGEPDPEVERVASAHGLRHREFHPLMLRRGELRPKAHEQAARRVRVMHPGEREEYAAAMAAGFGAPPEVMAPLSSPEVFAVPGVVAYVAEDDGQIAAVGLGISAGEAVGVFNIATVPGQRGRGYGRAVTERIVADGIARGARLAYLTSSEAGFGLYQSMGFRTVERWVYLLPSA